MLFNSLEYLIFFPLVAACFFLLPDAARRVFLLAASYYFYLSWKIEYGILIVLTTALNFYASVYMDKTENKTVRKALLGFSLFVSLGVLFIFKYYNFFVSSANELLKTTGSNGSLPLLNVLLPVGISFYTFQALSYTIDVYRKEIKAEKNIILFALFISFFPQLVAGPIERAGNLLRQLHKRQTFDFERMSDGLKLILWGLFKKVVIADRLSILVTQVYGNPHDYAGLPLLIATYFFAFQIYCDFSGYSDIAVGSARVLGYELMENFQRPYFSQNIAEFWRRWHISLSTWFRDYIYIPLGGSRQGKWKLYRNILIVFFICGVWHGAAWTFIAWGVLHGAYLLGHNLMSGIGGRVSTWLDLQRFPFAVKLFNVFVTFHLVAFSWIFFRAESISDALYIAGNLFTDFNLSLKFDMGMSGYEFSIAILAIALMEIFHMIQRHGSIRHMLARKPRWMRWAAYYGLIASILMFGEFSLKEFIYFQF